MVDVSNILRKRSPVSVRRKSRLTSKVLLDFVFENHLVFFENQDRFQLINRYQLISRKLAMIYSRVSKIFDKKSTYSVEKNNYFVEGWRNFCFFFIESSNSFLFSSGSVKSNRIAINTIPGSPQDLSDQAKCEPMFTLSANPSAELIEKENIANSDEDDDDDDEQTPVPADDEEPTECTKNHFHSLCFYFRFLADVQEEKLVIITTEINAKQKCLEMLENARKRSDAIRQRYEERIKVLSERIQSAEDEKQAAVTKLSSFEIKSFPHLNNLLFRFGIT